MLCDTVETLFARIAENRQSADGEGWSTVVSASFLEIEREALIDMQQDWQHNTRLRIRETRERGIYVEDITEHVVTSVDAFRQELAIAMEVRTPDICSFCSSFNIDLVRHVESIDAAI